jgi:perosamine synthetase
MTKLAINGGSKVRTRPFASNAVIGSEERKRVGDVLDSGILSGFVAKAGDNFLGGPQVKELERIIKGYFKIEHAVTANSATAGLHAAVAACGIGPGDEVIVPPYTMSATATAVIMANAVPVFADIEEDTFCLNPADIEKNITPRTKAIIVVHLFGGPADMDSIMSIAEKNDLYVIEDCAQAPGGIYKDRLVGTIADIGVFSLNQHKTITSGEGGFAITDDDNLAMRMRLIRNHGEVIAESMKIEDIDGIVGFNYRMTELEAAVSIGQFKRLDELNEYRIGLAEYFTKKLDHFEFFTLPQNTRSNKHVYFVYPIKFDENIAGISRDIFAKALNAEGIPCGAGYVRPIYLEPMYQKKIAYGKKGWPFTSIGNVNYSKGICPVCEKMHEHKLLMTGICRYPNTETDIDDAVRASEKIGNNISELKSENRR